MCGPIASHSSISSYSARLREFGIALREGDRVMVTGVRVKASR